MAVSINNWDVMKYKLSYLMTVLDNINSLILDKGNIINTNDLETGLEIFEEVFKEFHEWVKVTLKYYNDCDTK